MTNGSHWSGVPPAFSCEKRATSIVALVSTLRSATIALDASKFSESLGTVAQPPSSAGTPQAKISGRRGPAMRSPL
jgi:hypothetical protein